MTSPTWIRWSGLAALLGGLVWTISWLLNSQTAEGNQTALRFTEGHLRAMLNLPLLLLLAGLVGLYRLYAGRCGKLGTLGFGLTLLGMALLLAGNVMEFGLLGDPTDDRGWVLVVLSFLVIPVGMLLFGIAVRRASVLPLLVGLALVGAIGIAVAEMQACGCGRADRGLGVWLFAFGLGWMALGFSLWATRGRETGQAIART
jgi:hypothetical protein